jgi:4-carboxymuconolactone decarboxylase
MDTYYHPKDLGRFAEMGQEAPELWQKFLDWYNAVFKDGALTEREKALIALGVAHAVQCPYCIDAFSTACLEKGSTPEQMTEAVHVAAALPVLRRFEDAGGAPELHPLFRDIVRPRPRGRTARHRPVQPDDHAAAELFRSSRVSGRAPG